MLSKQTVEQLIRDKIIRINYSFSNVEQGIQQHPEEQFVNPDDEKAIGTKMFNKNFKADRLSITMGAVAVSHSIKRMKGRVNFHNKDNNFDLLQTNNEFEILPGEMVSVCSNERIKIEGNYGAYILPRLTIADAGLFYIPSYIDPYWDGLMQAVLYNFSNNGINIRICEALSVCRFYELKGDVDKQFKEIFPVTNHHYGQNWPGIFEGSRDPIRRGKEPIQRIKNRFDISNILKSLDTFLKKNITILLSGSILLVISSVYLAFTYVLFEVPKLKEQIELVSRIPDSGEIALTIPKGETSVIHKEVFNRSIKNIQTIWTESVEENKFIKSITTNKREIDHSKTEVSFIIKLKEPLQIGTTFRVQYLLVD